MQQKGSCYKLLLLKTLYFSNDENGDTVKSTVKSIKNYPGVDNFFVTETTQMAKERHEKVKEREAQKSFPALGICEAKKYIYK